jgi:hypothetical protein
MPRLLFSVPCSEAIVSQQNTVSMITVLETITLDVPEDGEIPVETNATARWHNVTFLERTDEDVGKTFEHRVTVESPDGEVLLEGLATPFEISKPFHRIVGSFPVFPVGRPGRYVVRGYLRQAGGDHEWTEIATYPVRVVHTPKPDTDPPIRVASGQDTL